MMHFVMHLLCEKRCVILVNPILKALLRLFHNVAVYPIDHVFCLVPHIIRDIIFGHIQRKHHGYSIMAQVMKTIVWKSCAL